MSTAIAITNIQTEPLTLERFRVQINKLATGQITAAEMQDLFEQLVSSEAAIKVELSKLTITQLRKVIAGYTGAEKKAQFVEAAFSALLERFILIDVFTWQPFSETHTAAIRRYLATITDEQIQGYAEQRRQHTASFKKAISNPETEVEFQLFVQYRGEAALTSEQRARRDEFHADRNKTLIEREQERKAVIQQVELNDIGFTVVEHFHSKRGHNVYIVTMSGRVEKETFNDLCIKARRLGGNYARAWQDSPAGFMFNERGNAEKFAGLKDGNVSKLDIVKEHQAEQKENTIERLETVAENLTIRAKESLHRERLVNTARRAGMAASAEAEAERSLSIARTIQRFADASKYDELKFLQVRSKSHIEMYERLIVRAKMLRVAATKESYSSYKDRPVCREDIDFAEYPYPCFSASTLRDCLAAIKGKPGCVLLYNRLTKYLGRYTDSSSLLVFKSQRFINDLNLLISKAKWADRYDLMRLKDARADYQRLQLLDIPDLPTLRAVLREYLKLRVERAQPDKLKELERELIGRNIPDYFPTPSHIVDQMLELAELQPGMRVLEPSAGKGNIGDEIKDQLGVDKIDVMECSNALRQILNLKGYNMIGCDFLTCLCPKPYDRIIMNPPFSAEIEHIQHAYEFLGKGGRIVSIMSEGPFFRNDSASQAFRQWLESVGGDSERLPAGSFKASERSTGVATRLVIIDKP